MTNTALAERDTMAAQPSGTAEPLHSALLPVFTGQQMGAALVAYRDLQHALDAAMPDQIIAIHGRAFRKKGYWRAIARAFHLNVACMKEESDERGWRVIYRATSTSGQFAEGDGACENEEKAEGQDSEHNVRSHAHTRAFNRSVSNLVGFGEVSAEEMRAPRGKRYSAAAPTAVIDTKTGAEVPAKAHPQPPVGYYYIGNYTFGNGWHEFLLLNAPGPAKFSTKTKVGELACQAFQRGLPVRIDDFTKKHGSDTEAYVNKLHVWRPDHNSTEPLDADDIPF